MKIAVTYENGEITQYFERSEHFKLYDIKDGQILFSMVLEALGCGQEALVDFLKSLRTSALICGNIGGTSRAKLEENGILLYGGVTGQADDAVQALLAGTLVYDPDIHSHQQCGESPSACSHCSHSCSERHTSPDCIPS